MMVNVGEVAEPLLLNFVEIHPEGGGWISPGRFTHSVRAVGI